MMDNDFKIEVGAIYLNEELNVKALVIDVTNDNVMYVIYKKGTFTENHYDFLKSFVLKVTKNNREYYFKRYVLLTCDIPKINKEIQEITIMLKQMYKLKQHNKKMRFLYIKNCKQFDKKVYNNYKKMTNEYEKYNSYKIKWFEKLLKEKKKQKKQFDREMTISIQNIFI